MRLHDLLAGLDVLELIGGDVDVTSVTNDSRRVRPGSLYACIPGAHVDGHDFADEAVRGGARALLVERILDLPVPGGPVAQACVPLVRGALGPAASALFGHPSRAMRCLGVTGTNGKTTTTFLLEAVTRAAGMRAGVIGTVGARVDGVPTPTPQITPTTPEAPDLQLLLAEMRDAGVGAVAMEVTSHGLARREVDGTTFAAVCFTNLSHEHLDYHGTLDAYREAKARLFDGSFAPAAAVNVDDAVGRDVAQRVERAGGRLFSFGLAPDARITAEAVEYGARGTAFGLVDREAGVSVAVRVPLVGPFNLSNALAAAATALAAGFDAGEVAAGLAACPPVPGRMEQVEQGQPFTVLVDYAHTPDALANVLAAARVLAAERRLVAVFGAGGDRDREKRPLMGAAVGRAADVAVLTSDNPRSEAPDAIAADVLSGLDGEAATIVVELDRRAAIRAALADAAPGDVVVIAGKGHETGQIVGSDTRPFDDRVVAREELETLGVELTAAEIARRTGGELHDGPADARATSFSIDSRALEPGACFVALHAVRDGHDFVADAVERGATVVLVARPVVAAEAAVVVVDDPLTALGRLGAHARGQFERARVVGVTGSAGKTGTKDLLAAALRGGGEVHASPGSYNNEAGVPLTILAAPASTASLVLEMGARAPGDIAALCAIARPTAGVITNIGMAHAGPLGGRAGVARVKGELFEALPATGVGVLDVDDDASRGIAARTPARILHVSARSTAGADVRASSMTLDGEIRPAFMIESPWGSARVQLSVHGDHQVVNALLAAAVALDAGVPLASVIDGLESVGPAPWRMEVLRRTDGVVVLHDAYNANPSSTEAALRALIQLDTDGRRVAVLGEMRELGAHSEEEHRRIGGVVATLGIDALVAVGPEAAPLAAAARAGDVGVEVVPDADAALDAVLAILEPGDAVLVKGSRDVGLERVALALARPPADPRADASERAT